MEQKVAYQIVEGWGCDSTKSDCSSHMQLEPDAGKGTRPRLLETASVFLLGTVAEPACVSLDF
jgi:hypothetical protein